MKKFLFLAMCVMISVCSFIAPASASASTRDPKPRTSWMSKIPVKLVVEQTATLSDGKTVTLYYQKNGDLLEVYSNDNLKGYSVDDLLALRETSFRLASAVKGKRVYHTTTAQARKIIKKAVSTYL